MQRPEENLQLLDLRGLLTLLRRRKQSIAMMTILIALLAVVFVAWRAPVYTSRAEVEVRPLTIDEQLQPFAADSFVNMETEAARVTAEPVAMLAASAMGLDPASSTDLVAVAEEVQVTIQPNTTFLEISCTGASAEEALVCAGSFAAAYVEDRINGAVRLYEERMSAEQDRIREVTDRVEQLRSQLSEPGAPRASIRAEIEAQNRLITAAQTNLLSLPTASPDAAVLSRSAALPMEPSNKDYLLTAVLAAILGLALGIGFALLRQRLAEPIVDGEDFERALDAPLLAAVPPLSTLPTRPYGPDPVLVTLSAPESPASQAYRGAAATLVHFAREGSLRVIALTGPSAGEGKTPATGNLAVALAQSGRQVIAVSCDLRNPTLHRFLDRNNDAGLTNLLLDTASVGDVLQATDTSGLFFIASGPMPDNPTDLLGNEGMGRLVAAMRTRFDFVLLDAGPGLVADALFLAPHADGMIVVADAAKTSRGAVAHLRQQLESAGGFITGGILNNWAPEHARQPYPYFVRPDPSLRPSGAAAEGRATSDGEGRNSAAQSRDPEEERDGNQAALAPPREERS